VIDSSFELQRRIPDFRLLVIGEGSERERLQQKYKDSGVIFVGRKEGKEKATYLRVSTILMIPRGIGLVALDGISAKVPIVSLKGNFHGPESVYLIDGESVYFANSEEAFVEKCELLIRQSQNVLSEPNYQQIEYSVQEMAEAFFNAIA
jgi:glycosyltransferase involved in cell wall biosynthesis